MESFKIIALSINFASFLVICFAAIIQSRKIHKQNQLFDAYKKRLDDNYKYQEELIKYCITDIYNRSVESEDYETAKKCLSVLDEMKNK